MKTRSIPSTATISSIWASPSAVSTWMASRIASLARRDNRRPCSRSRRPGPARRRAGRAADSGLRPRRRAPGRPCRCAAPARRPPPNPAPTGSPRAGGPAPAQWPAPGGHRPRGSSPRAGRDRSGHVPGRCRENRALPPPSPRQRRDGNGGKAADEPVACCQSAAQSRHGAQSSPSRLRTCIGLIRCGGRPGRRHAGRRQPAHSGSPHRFPSRGRAGRPARRRRDRPPRARRRRRRGRPVR